MSEQPKPRSPAPSSSDEASLTSSGPWPRDGEPDGSRPSHTGSKPPLPQRISRNAPRPTSAAPPSRAEAVTLPAVTEGDSDTGGMKIVTISPPTNSIPDVEPERALPRRQDPYLGCTIDGRYKVEDIIGEGGMGVVYRCTHKFIGKKVAMKVLRADLARDRELMERFLNEAKAASAIGNPHIIDISDFGELPDGSTYFVMEYLEGAPLSAQVDEEHPLPIPRLVHIARQLAEGLSAAHHASIIHRDLKPDNIFLVSRGHERDFVKILDFGIAKVSTSAEGRLTRAGAVFGTPHYMSPEQAAGTPMDHRGDIYSFGVILYELASGKVPFDADNFMGILTQHMYKAPVPIRALVPEPHDVPPGLEAIVLKCLSKRPELRYQTMDEVITDLDKLKQGIIPDAVPEMMARSGGFNVPADYFKRAGMPAPVPATPTRRVRSRWPLYAGLAGVSVAVGMVVTIFVSSASSTATPTSEPTPAPSPTRAPAAAPAPGSPTEELAVSRQVALAVEPLDAHVYRADNDLGTSPIVIDVQEGKTAVLEIRRDGYKTRTIRLDGTTAKASVKLERAVVAHPTVRGQVPSTAGVPVKPKPKPSIGGSDIVNPWE